VRFERRLRLLSPESFLTVDVIFTQISIGVASLIREYGRAASRQVGRQKEREKERKREREKERKREREIVSFCDGNSLMNDSSFPFDSSAFS
jgi:hypothetical protein